MVLLWSRCGWYVRATHCFLLFLCMRSLYIQKTSPNPIFLFDEFNNNNNNNAFMNSGFIYRIENISTWKPKQEQEIK